MPSPELNISVMFVHLSVISSDINPVMAARAGARARASWKLYCIIVSGLWGFPRVTLKISTPYLFLIASASLSRRASTPGVVLIIFSLNEVKSTRRTSASPRRCRISDPKSASRSGVAGLCSSSLSATAASIYSVGGSE